MSADRRWVRAAPVHTGPAGNSLDVLSWRDVDLASVALAAMAAGYVMAIAGLWAGRVPGLSAIDIADYGRRYVVSDRPSAWILGFACHLANFLLVLAWATLIEPNLEWPRWLEGLAWGEFLAVVLAGALVSPLNGQGFMGMRSGNLRFATTNVVMHGRRFRTRWPTFPRLGPQPHRYSWASSSSAWFPTLLGNAASCRRGCRNGCRAARSARQRTKRRGLISGRCRRSGTRRSARRAWSSTLRPWERQRQRPSRSTGRACWHR